MLKISIEKLGYIGLSFVLIMERNKKYKVIRYDIEIQS